MKEFNVSNGEGQLIIHLFGDNSKYEVNYDHGQITFNSQDFKYIVPEGIGYTATFFAPDPNTGKRKYLMGNIRDLYRDTTPTDFGLTNLSDVAIGSSHFTEEIVIGGINESTPVIAPAGVKIYVNGVEVSSGTTVENGDAVKFEITASQDFETATNYNLSVGDITKVFSITTEIGVRQTCKEWRDAGFDTDGEYLINPTGNQVFKAYCDMTTDGGGWTLVFYSNSDNVNRTTIQNGDWNSGPTVNFSRLYSFKDIKRNGVYEFFIHDSSTIFRNVIFTQTNSYLENPNNNSFTQTGGNFYYSSQASGWKGLALGSYGNSSMQSSCTLAMTYDGRSWTYCLQDQLSGNYNTGPWFYDSNIGGYDAGSQQWVKVYQR